MLALQLWLYKSTCKAVNNKALRHSNRESKRPCACEISSCVVIASVNPDAFASSNSLQARRNKVYKQCFSVGNCGAQCTPELSTHASKVNDWYKNGVKIDVLILISHLVTFYGSADTILHFSAGHDKQICTKRFFPQHTNMRYILTEFFSFEHSATNFLATIICPSTMLQWSLLFKLRLWYS